VSCPFNLSISVSSTHIDGLDTRQAQASWHWVLSIFRLDSVFHVQQVAYADSLLERSPSMSLVSGEKSNFQFILRLLNTNVEGKQKVMYALTKIKGVGRRYSNLVCKKADVDLNKR
jgi:hypothetical protein